MKTFYLIQNDALEDYMSGKSKGRNKEGTPGDGGNPGSGGGQAACDTPNPPWWCGLYDEDPGEAGASIDSGIYLGLFIGLVIGIYFIFKKRKL